MGFLDIFKNKKTAVMQYAPTQNGNTPYYSDFGTNIYASDIVVQSIRCKANEFKKLLPRHIRISGDKETVITTSSIARVLANPNPYMTTADFFEKITILLELNKNVYIYPTWYMTKAGERIYTGLYPLKPRQVTYLVDDSGAYFMQLDFCNGYSITIPTTDIIHWRKDYGVNDYFGGGVAGGNDDVGLLTMLQRYDMLLQSISKALECSCQVNGIVKVNGYMTSDNQKAERDQFVSDLQNNKSGVLVTDAKTEYVNIDRDIKLIDADTLNAMYEMILRANGTSLAILSGDYTKAQKEAYYEHALEGDIRSLAQAFTKTVFTEREVSFGNAIALYPQDIAFMSMSEKLQALQVGLPAGVFTRNEARELLGLPPIENGDEIPQGYNLIVNTDKSTEEDTNGQQQE